MAVHHVQQHGQSHAVGGVNQVLEFLGRAEAGGNRKEVADVVPE